MCETAQVARGEGGEEGMSKAELFMAPLGTEGRDAAFDAEEESGWVRGVQPLWVPRPTHLGANADEDYAPIATELAAVEASDYEGGDDEVRDKGLRDLEEGYEGTGLDVGEAVEGDGSVAIGSC
ncbi:unnamed protein product [Closterium sp. Naga37s-1]|nr:unnamed protein product [Closterium sp. Naga37s-1]